MALHKKMTWKILLVDDDPDNIYVFTHILKRAGYEIITAINGVEAVKLAKSESPDLILMDMQLPLMSGYEATKEIRKVADIPIIALTASVMHSDREKAMKAGCAEYLCKPVELHDFLKKINNFFEERSLNA